MRLGIHDRLLLLQVLPKEGDLVTLRIVREVRDALSFSEQEHTRFHFTYPEKGRVEWDKSTEVLKEVDIGPTAHGLIAKGFDALSKEGKLRLEWLPLVEQFTNGATPSLALVREPPEPAVG